MDDVRGGRGAPAGRSRSPKRQAAAGRPAVAVVGGGLAGLALARALQVDSVTAAGAAVIVLEASVTLSSPFAGALTIHQAAARALRRLGLWEEWLRIREEDSQEPDQSEGCASREALLNMLAGSLRPGTLRLGCGLVGLRDAGGLGLLCELQGGNVLGPFDVVVGADGLRSSVRRLAALPPLRRARLRVLLLGDAQREFGRERDLGLRRIRSGANEALESAVSLAGSLAEALHGRGGAAPPSGAGPEPLGGLRAHSAELALCWASWLRYSAGELGARCRRRPP
ncbi:unnamed protein product [Prorocentrum cordatum]|uniref:FAD-binding domain-containing protein n=1 Tax=Prorocentrum cordatum TaxID=2364126 RepID=A0ABN9XL00_9DINO|nr:unnamed protein product [Polarella glacialis]